jgi:hypothetical protein
MHEKTRLDIFIAAPKHGRPSAKYIQKPMEDFLIFPKMFCNTHIGFLPSKILPPFAGISGNIPATFPVSDRMKDRGFFKKRKRRLLRYLFVISCKLGKSPGGG